MTGPLTRTSFKGVWAAALTPFDDQERFAEDIFRENVRRLHAAGVHGIYITDTDGEFYAIELDEFRAIVDVFAEEANRLGFASMVGATWCNTRGVLDRVRYAAAKGILGAHVGHPLYMAMAPDSVRRFWQDVSQAAPDWFGLVHYNTPHLPNYFGPADYAALSREIPNLIGVKHVTRDIFELTRVVEEAPDLSHFTLEYTMSAGLSAGARGVHSWFANFNPRYVLDWYDDIVCGRLDSARARQQRMIGFIQAKDILRGPGNQYGIVNKAMAAASPFLVPSTHTRRPYLPVSDEAMGNFRRVVLERFTDLLWHA
jgi:dihydrodipicolinate synthase/N-acetylneuraminate lyase